MPAAFRIDAHEKNGRKLQFLDFGSLSIQFPSIICRHITVGLNPANSFPSILSNLIGMKAVLVVVESETAVFKLTDLQRTTVHPVGDYNRAAYKFIFGHIHTSHAVDVREVTVIAARIRERSHLKKHRSAFRSVGDKFPAAQVFRQKGSCITPPLSK